MALMAISSWLGSAKGGPKAPVFFDKVNNKDVSAFVPAKAVSFLWGQRSSVPLSPATGFSA
jgi:hypothetical protein